jgi:PhoH-like ATPase
LVTKDISLRTIAKASGVMVQDYENDNLSQSSKPYNGYRTINGLSNDIIDSLYKDGYIGGLDKIKDPLPNEYFTFKAGKQSALCRYNKNDQQYKLIKSYTAFGISPRNSEQTFLMDALSNPDISLVTVTGNSGTGKTLIATAVGLHNKKDYRKILIARSTVDMGRSIGFLPGTLEDKVNPYLQPFFDNLDIIGENATQNGKSGKDKIKELLDNDKISIEVLSFIRGRSLPNVYFIIDEGQNLSPHEIKTIITRAGEGAKIIILGDVEQIDTPYLDSRSNGLSGVINSMKDETIAAHITLKHGQRSLLAEIASKKL